MSGTDQWFASTACQGFVARWGGSAPEEDSPSDKVTLLPSERLAAPALPRFFLEPMDRCYLNHKPSFKITKNIHLSPWSFPNLQPSSPSLLQHMAGEPRPDQKFLRCMDYSPPGLGQPPVCGTRKASRHLCSFAAPRQRGGTAVF